MSGDLLSPISCLLSHPGDTDDEAMNWYLQRMERLLLVVQELSLAYSLERIMEIVRVAARDLTGSDGASFVLREDDNCYYADEDAIAPLWKGQRFPMKTCIGGWVMLNRTPAIIADVYQDERIPWAAYRPTFVKSLVTVPIRTLDPLGTIGTYWAQPHAATTAEVKLLQALADTTAVAIENVRVHSELEQRVCDRTAQLQAANLKLSEEVQERQAAESQVHHLSITDDLTGLYNRRGFFLLVTKALALAQRRQQPCSLLFLDLDGLKQTNDLYGHHMGDETIRAAADVLRHSCRESDILARLGGDEFAVFIQDVVSCTLPLQQRLQRQIDHFNQTANAPFTLSISVGLQAYDPAHPLSLEELLTLADAQMYERKRLKKVQ